jgi:hypothetical protein
MKLHIVQFSPASYWGAYTVLSNRKEALLIFVLEYMKLTFRRKVSQHRRLIKL